jgi:hypothetical protein
VLLSDRTGAIFEISVSLTKPPTRCRDSRHTSNLTGAKTLFAVIVEKICDRGSGAGTGTFDALHALHAKSQERPPAMHIAPVLTPHGLLVLDKAAPQAIDASGCPRSRARDWSVRLRAVQVMGFYAWAPTRSERRCLPPYRTGASWERAM